MDHYLSITDLIFCKIQSDVPDLGVWQTMKLWGGIEETRKPTDRQAAG